MVQQTKWNQCVLEKGLFFIFACIIHDDGQTTMMLLCLLLFDRYTQKHSLHDIYLSIIISAYIVSAVLCLGPVCCRKFVYVYTTNLWMSYKDTMINDAYPHIDIIALFGRNLFYGFWCGGDMFRATHLVVNDL